MFAEVRHFRLGQLFEIRVFHLYGVFMRPAVKDYFHVFL